MTGRKVRTVVAEHVLPTLMRYVHMYLQGWAANSPHLTLVISIQHNNRPESPLADLPGGPSLDSLPILGSAPARLAIHPTQQVLRLGSEKEETIKPTWVVLLVFPTLFLLISPRSQESRHLGSTLLPESQVTDGPIWGGDRHIFPRKDGTNSMLLRAGRVTVRPQYLAQVSRRARALATSWQLQQDNPEKAGCDAESDGRQSVRASRGVCDDRLGSQCRTHMKYSVMTCCYATGRTSLLVHEEHVTTQVRYIQVNRRSKYHVPLGYAFLRVTTLLGRAWPPHYPWNIEI